MALDVRPANGKYMRVASRASDTRSQQKFLRALAQLPPALQGPVLRSGRAKVVWPSTSRTARRPQPLMTRVLAGELQLRSVLLLAATLLLVAIVTALGSNF